MKKTKCTVCKKEIWRYPSQLKVAPRSVCSFKCKCLFVAKLRLGSNNHNWKGSKVGYNGIHNWVKRRLTKPKTCDLCKKKAKRIDLANISQKYKRDLSDWEWLCRKCHMTKDGRLKLLSEQNITGKYVECKICSKKIWSNKCRPRQYCSKKCYGKAEFGTIRIKRITLRCEGCRTVFSKERWRKKRFCSYKCFSKWYRGENFKKWNKAL